MYNHNDQTVTQQRSIEVMKLIYVHPVTR